MTYIQQGETWATTRSKINQVIKVSYTELLADTELTYSGGLSGTVTAGDLYPTTDGMWFEVAASGASDQHATTAGGVKLYEAGPNFSTRARAVAWIARGGTPPNGTIITADGMFYERDSSVTSLPGMSGWKPAESVFSEHFGAVGDGTTDDSDAIQAAIDYVNSIGGGVVYIQGKAYLLDTARMGDDPEANETGLIVLKATVSLKGAGRGVSILKRGTATTDSVVWVNSGDDHFIRNLQVDGNDAAMATATHGILKQGDMSGLAIENNTIKNCGSFGIGLQDHDDGSAGYTNNVLISGNVIENVGADGIDVKGRAGTANYGNKIVNNTIRQYGKRTALVEQAGIDVRGQWYVAGNHVENIGESDAHGIRLRPDPGAGEVGATRTRVIGNRIISDTSGTTFGLTVADSYCVVAGNIVDTFGTAYYIGTGSGTADRNLLSANAAFGCTTAFECDGDDNLIADSKIVDCTTAFNFGGNDNRAVGGHADGTVTTGISDSGTGNEVFLVRGVRDMLFADGSASSPSVTNIGDLDTGLFWPAANVLAAAAGGAEQWRVTSSGLIVGGTSADANGAKLTVNEAIASRGARFLSSRANIGDDTALSFTPADERGVLMVMANDKFAAVYYNVSTGATTVKSGLDDTYFTAIANTVLTGTTGADLDFSISASSSDGKIYFENRKGGALAFTFNILASRD